jgi:LEA14-like dessication related protein
VKRGEHREIERKEREISYEVRVRVRVRGEQREIERKERETS